MREMKVTQMDKIVADMMQYICKEICKFKTCGEESTAVHKNCTMLNFTSKITGQYNRINDFYNSKPQSI